MAKMGMIDNYLGEARSRQFSQMIFDQRPGTRAQQRLGQDISERTHALAASRREYHGLE
jgi:hypothetical protein